MKGVAKHFVTLQGGRGLVHLTQDGVRRRAAGLEVRAEIVMAQHKSRPAMRRIRRAGGGGEYDAIDEPTMGA